MRMFFITHSCSPETLTSHRGQLQAGQQVLRTGEVVPGFNLIPPWPCLILRRSQGVCVLVYIHTYVYRKGRRKCVFNPKAKALRLAER